MAELKRTLNVTDLTFLFVGMVIGSGIFLTPGAVLVHAGGTIVPAMLAWLAGGILSLLGALTYAELSTMKPQAGGFYVFIRDCYGDFLAYMFGWTLFTVVATGGVATLAVAFSKYLGQLISLTPSGEKVAAVGMVTAVGALNVWGTRKSANTTNWSTAIKASAILVMSVALLIAGKGWAGSAPYLFPKTVNASLMSGVGVSMVAVLWAYEGWQYCTFIAGEVIRPARSIPIAFMTGSAILIGLYLLANFGYLAALGPGQAGQTTSIAAVSVSAVIGPVYGKLVALVILISTFSAANATLLGCSRVFFAMADDGLFFKRLAEVHPRFGTPAISIAACTVWSAILAISGTFEQLFTYVVFIGWIFYGLSAFTLFIYRKRQPGLARPYRVPGYPWTTILFIVAVAALVGNNIIAQPVDSAKGLAVVFIGAPIYLIWRGRGKRALQIEGTSQEADSMSEVSAEVGSGKAEATSE